MKHALALTALLTLASCGTWNDLTPTEQALWGVAGIALGTAAYCADGIGDGDCF